MRKWKKNGCTKISVTGLTEPFFVKIESYDK